MHLLCSAHLAQVEHLETRYISQPLRLFRLPPTSYHLPPTSYILQVEQERARREQAQANEERQRAGMQKRMMWLLHQQVQRHWLLAQMC